MIRFFLLSLCLLLMSGIVAQTVGLMTNTPAAFNGYTLVAPTGATRTHLIDNCGRVINQWDSEYRAGEAAYLLNDGSLLRTARQPSTVFTGGGMGGRLERFNWDGELTWSYTLANDTAHHHHDMAWMPNGNVLILAWEYRSPEQAAAAGRVDDGPLWPPMIIEVVPDGSEGGQVVWEWHAWDHLIQNVDPDLPNYGNPSDHPGRFDVNYGEVSSGGGPGGPGSGTGGDWFHCNAVAFHPGLNQIVLNSRNWNEFYIINHATSTEEAMGFAGDVLYRWGNPAAYGRGTSTDQVLYTQHDPHWLADEGPTSLGGNPDATMLVYNNGNARPGGPASTVEELTLPLQPDGTYFLSDVEAYGPVSLDWVYPQFPFLDFFSPNISGAQRQPNGNTLICEGNDGQLFEITPEGDIVWEYITAYSQFGAAVQGENPIGNSTFRAYRYAPDYPAFDGRDMSPGDPVESNPLPFDCQIYPASNNTTVQRLYTDDIQLTFGPNPARSILRLESNLPIRWNIRDIAGRSLLGEMKTSNYHIIDVSHLSEGAYLMVVSREYGPFTSTHKILIEP